MLAGDLIHIMDVSLTRRQVMQQMDMHESRECLLLSPPSGLESCQRSMPLLVLTRKSWIYGGRLLVPLP